MESSKVSYYENSKNLVDDSVVQKTMRFWEHGTVIFYAQRRHQIEIIPEFVVSLLVSLTFVALAVWLQPWNWFSNQYTHENAGVMPLIVALSIIIPWCYFGVEVLRWSTESIVLTNRGLYNPHFKILDLDFKCPRQDWITKSVASVPLSHKIIGLDVGTLEYKDPKENKFNKTPAVSHPHRLHGLIPVADEYKNPAQKNEVGWRL